MVKRRLPRSNESRFNALRLAKARKDSVPAPLVIPLTAGTITRLDAFYPPYKLKIEAAEAALQAQTSVSAQVKEAKTSGTLFVSHFYNALQNAIARKTFEPSVRTFYGLAASDGNLPSIKTEADVTYWGGKAATGEAARIAAGGAPITFPSIAEVNTAVSNFNTLNLQQANAKEAFDTAQEDIAALNPEADKLILKMWNETEAAFDEGDKASMRRKAREWGVVYVTEGVPTVLSGIIRDNNGAPLEGAAALLVETGTDDLANNEGRFELPTTATGDLTLRVSFPGLPDVEVLINIPEGSEGKTIELPDIIMGGAPTPADVINVGGFTANAANGASLTGVTISATAAGTTGPLTTLSAAGGIYNIHATGVPAGETFHAFITASFPGFVTQTIELDVSGGNTYIVNFVLVAE